MDHLADACKISGDKLRQLNLYSNGDATPFGMIMGEEFAGQWNIPKMWNRIYSEFDYRARRASIDEFNKNHTFKKRGICILPTKFGIGETGLGYM